MKYIMMMLTISFGIGSCGVQETPIVEEVAVSESLTIVDKAVIEKQEIVIEKDDIKNTTETGEGKIEGNSTLEQQQEENFSIEEKQVVLYDALSIPTLRESEIVGSDLVLEELLSKTALYTRYRISYKSGDLQLSGIMNIPVGDGPFPLLILAHGYIDPSIYTNGRGLKREQDYFANNGYAVLHPDYRNHAFSDKVSDVPYDFRLGYTEDVIASIYAAQNSQLPELQSIDTKKVGLLGHSMGGGISQNISVVRPDLIDAVVLYGPVSNDEYTNFEKFQIGRSTRSSRVLQVLTDHQKPEQNPFFWNTVSSRIFFSDIKAPFMIFSGTSDTDTPAEWAQGIAADLEKYNKDVELVIYDGEKHEFINRWPDFMNSSKEFFDENVK